MSFEQISKEEIINALQKEAMKEYYVYDGSNRVIEQYQAPTDTPEGGACLRTDYTYVGGTTNREKMKETIVPWQTIWEI